MSFIKHDKKYEAVSSTNASVVYATISGFAEKKYKYWFSDYVFVLEVYWTDKKTTFIKRSYEDVLKLHHNLRDHFNSKYEKGLMKSPVFIPKLEELYLHQCKVLYCNLIRKIKALRVLSEAKESSQSLQEFLWYACKKYGKVTKIGTSIISIEKGRNWTRKSYSSLSLPVLPMYEEAYQFLQQFVKCALGKKFLQKSSVGLAEHREMELQSFFKQLLEGNPLISSNKIILDFFSRWQTDPIPSETSNSDNASDDDDNDDNVLFDR